MHRSQVLRNQVLKVEIILFTYSILFYPIIYITYYILLMKSHRVTTKMKRHISMDNSFPYMYEMIKQVEGKEEANRLISQCLLNVNLRRRHINVRPPFLIYGAMLRENSNDVQFW